MDIKLLQSKINLLEAQKKQLTDCGLFGESEITRLSKHIDDDLQKCRTEKDALENQCAQ